MPVYLCYAPQVYVPTLVLKNSTHIMLQGQKVSAGMYLLLREVMFIYTFLSTIFVAAETLLR